MNKILLALAAASLSPAMADAGLVLHYPMDVDASGFVTENIKGGHLGYNGKFAPEAVAGVEGNSLRFDGYTTYAEGNVQLGGVTDRMTVSLWVAPETFPIVKIDERTDERIVLAGNLDNSSKQGWAVTLGYDGKYGFDGFASGWAVKVIADDILDRGCWNNITVTADRTAKKVLVYRNGTLTGSGKISSSLSHGATFRIGKGEENIYSGPFLTNTFNGMIDDVKVYDEVLDANTIAGFKTASTPDFAVSPSRFEGDLLRPKFHGMPSANWTNESHGLTYSDGRYHIFFQKNANGPFMARLHWGHLSSPDMVSWKEEPIAIAPGETYDIKGCWSGCLFSDDVITGGKTAALYTAVDYAKAVIAMARPEADDLKSWIKEGVNPVVNGRPAGLSDDFRDPYFFRDGDNAYIIVGSSKDNVGVATLHKYMPSTNTWTNAGDLFFKGDSKNQDGRFIEMPNVTKMPNGKWLFTYTPLETSTGVRTLYRTGSINPDGSFKSDKSTPRQVELISRDGYGLLSPSIMQREGRTIAIGIVPDKLGSGDNAELGWAHCYSLPREWNLDDNGNLLQRPAAELSGLRTATRFSQDDFELNGQTSLGPVAGRQVEVKGVFTVGTSRFGLRVLENSNGACVISYQPSTRQLEVDMTALNRLSNDGWSYKGVYNATLPENIPAGSDLTLNVFLDGSVLDIFVNDKWATSIRIFATDADADGVSAFADSTVNVRSLKAWNLSAEGNSAVEGVYDDLDNTDGKIYRIDGTYTGIKTVCGELPAGLEPGLYIVGGNKRLVR